MFRFFKKLFNRNSDPFNEGMTRRKLPSRFPADMSVSLRRGSGMTMGELSIFLIEGRSYLSDERGYADFTMSKEEMKHVFEEFKRMKLDKVELEEYIRLDYPNTDIYIEWSGISFSRGITQAHRIKEKSEGNFYGCVHLIQNIGEEKTKDKVFQKQPYRT